MKSMNRHTEDRSTLGILYDNYRYTYPTTQQSAQREIESLYQELYGHALANAEEVTAVFIALCDDSSRFAYIDGVKTGVMLALDLELDSAMFGGACDA